jgi:hypothetical protein
MNESSSSELFYKSISGIGILLACDKYVDCLLYFLFVVPVVGIYHCAVFGLCQLGVRKSSSTHSLVCFA